MNTIVLEFGSLVNSYSHYILEIHTKCTVIKLQSDMRKTSVFYFAQDYYGPNRAHGINKLRNETLEKQNSSHLR